VSPLDPLSVTPWHGPLLVLRDDALQLRLGLLMGVLVLLYGHVLSEF
jgi:hypothetical protein